MKKITKLILLGALSLSSLNASELLFDLKAQDFSKTLTDTTINAKYKVSNKIIIETNLLKRSVGYYRTNQGQTGFLNIEINQELNNWKLNLDVIYDSYDNYMGKQRGGTRLIKFRDNQGEVITLEFTYNKFTVNGKEFKIALDSKQLNIGIKMNVSTLQVLINSQSVYNQKITFSQLKNISSSFLTYAMGNYKAFDMLNSMTLYSND